MGLKKKFKKKAQVSKKKLKKLKKRILEKRFPKKKKLKVKKRYGRWCSEVKGRLPSPIECHFRRNLSNVCKVCTNTVNYGLWKQGAYNKVEDDIDALVDFTKPENTPTLLQAPVFKVRKLKKKIKKHKNK